MTGDVAPARHRITLPATCPMHGSAPGTANLEVIQFPSGDVGLDPRCHRRCALRLSLEAAAAYRQATEHLVTMHHAVVRHG
jgi:hypothetical protein